MAKVVFKGYRPNTASMARFLLSGRVKRVAKEAADDVADVASGYAERHSRTGRLAAGYKTDDTIGGANLEGGPRRVGVVYNDVPYAAVDELGSDGRRPRYNLTRAGQLFDTPRGLVKARPRG